MFCIVSPDIAVAVFNLSALEGGFRNHYVEAAMDCQQEGNVRLYGPIGPAMWLRKSRDWKIFGEQLPVKRDD
jgi:hypothetical protein